ncbi:hypothetical protein LDENG_00064770 [Lucifuga dentata]|nr:hypothetical protein LDENG_00064770 [Lucifuga dentata]
MEWRQQSSFSCADAFQEAQRWIEEVTGKSFGSNVFRAALENGVLLCDLINQLKPGLIKRVNRLSTPIAGLDNVNVFLKACAKLGLNEAQLFHPGDLQDLSTRVTLRRDESNRRLKNVLITIYWLGRKAQLDPFYSGSQLNFKAFEGLLGLALSKSLDEGSNVPEKESAFKECWYAEREEFLRIKPGYKRGDSVDRKGLRPSKEGCESDTEAEQGFRMETTEPSAQQSRDYFLPPLLQRKQRREENGRGCTSPLTSHKALGASKDNFDFDFISWVRLSHAVLLFELTVPSYIPTLILIKGSKEHLIILHLACQIQVKPGRPLQVNPGWIWSKSLSDIPMVYPVQKVPDGNDIFEVGQDPSRAKVCNQENAQKSSMSAKESEAKWQDDLTKWKNRRRNTKSDVKTLLDQESVISQMTNGAVPNLEKNKTQGGLLNRDQQSTSSNNPAPCPSSTSPTSKSSSSDLRPHTRLLLARSYITEAPYSPTAPYSPHNSAHTQEYPIGTTPASDCHIVGEETHSTFLASDVAVVATPPLDCPFSSQTQVKALGSTVPFQVASDLGLLGFSDDISFVVTTILPETTKLTCSTDSMASLASHKENSLCVDPQVPTFYDSAVNKTAADTLEDFSQQNQDEAQTTSWEQAAEQVRGQQTAGFHRYFSRTGSWSGSARLPRGYRRSEGSSRLSAAITAKPFGTKQSRVLSLPRLSNVDDSQSLLLNSERDGSLQPTKSTLKREVATSQMRSQFQPSVRQKANQAKENETEQREEGKCVNFSSQTNGYYHEPCPETQLLPQSYSILQPNHSKNLTLAPSVSTNVPKVDHSDMRVSLTLKPNSRPDFGFQTHWDSTGLRVKFIQLGSPAELCQLCVDDEIVAIDGIAVAHMSYDKWKNKMTSALQSGSITMDIRRYGNKEWNTGDGSNHNQPGQSRMTLNLTAAAPLLIGCPDHHASSTVSTETTIRKLSKYDGQTDNSKVMDGQFADNPRTTRSKGGSESAISDLQVPSLSPSSSSWSWDHEKDRRRQEKWQEEQERLLQEQYRRDQERLEAEWHRAQQDALGELYRKAGNTCEKSNGAVSPAGVQLPVNGVTNKTRKDEQSSDMEELKEAGSKPSGVQNKISEPDWAKSLSTPTLAGFHKQTKGEQRKSKGQGVSKAEQERQQILEEMKKRTQLLTDNSWIRQRSSSSSMYKEPVCVGAPMKRYESLDNHQTWHQSPVLTTTEIYPRPHSAAAGYFPPSRNSSSHYSTGGTLTQSLPVSQHHGSVWAATGILEEQRPESRFGSETGNPTVSPAISNSSMPLPPPCDLIAVLHITE